MSKCPKCTKGPTGMEGHLDLFVNTINGGSMQFKCRTCATLWMRRVNDKGVDWTDSLGVESGPRVPQSSRS
jgi:hypothetical protein